MATNLVSATLETSFKNVHKFVRERGVLSHSRNVSPVHRGEVINGGFGLVLDGTEVSEYNCPVINYTLSCDCHGMIAKYHLAYLYPGHSLQEAADRTKMMLSWDVLNGVRK